MTTIKGFILWLTKFQRQIASLAVLASVSALQEQFQKAMFITSILTFALIAALAQAFALWALFIRKENNNSVQNPIMGNE